MEGVILFADDHVLENNFENKLFNALSKERKHPVLPIVNLDLLETSIISTSSIKALIVDWNFENVDQEFKEAGVGAINETPFDKLMNLEIFSLIYIYSEKSGLELTESGIMLKERYKDKLEFRTKDKSGDIDEKVLSEKTKILEDLSNMSQKIENIKIPIHWTQKINQSVQKIFSELNEIDKNWISDLYKTAEDDGVEPSLEVINLFHNLLSEKIIQSKSLRDFIKEAVSDEGTIEPEKYAQLFRTFLYSYLDKLNDPIMTGDIFDFGNDTFGILITPECDISKTKDEYEFLVFKNNSVADFEFLTQFSLAKKSLKAIVKEIINRDLTSKEGQKINESLSVVENNIMHQVFNQPHQRLYVLPCFDSGDKNIRTKAQIDFRGSLVFKKVSEVNGENRVCKLNSPYIQDLRQRFLSYKGRVGVPSFPKNLRTWLLEE